MYNQYYLSCVGVCPDGESGANHQKHPQYASNQAIRKLHSAILQDVLDDPHVLELWEANSAAIPAKYEAYSLELLKTIVELWANVRCFSFAAGCNILLQKAATKKQGTRRALKTRGTEKEA